MVWPHQSLGELVLGIDVHVGVRQATEFRLFLGRVMFPDDVVNLFNVFTGENVAAALLPHAPVVGRLGETQVVVAHAGTSALQTLLKIVENNETFVFVVMHG